jgi:preprotein translocase subunit SecE
MNKIMQYSTEVKSELSKVSWPKRKELTETTWVVLFICIAFSLCVFFLDIALSRIIGLIF